MNMFKFDWSNKGNSSNKKQSVFKVIPTLYKGCFFRSRLEARWAVFLDKAGIKWQYEVEGYQLDSKWYLPDFYLPDWHCWLEIKGTKDYKAQLSCEELGRYTIKPVLFAVGLPNNGFRPWASRTDGVIELFCYRTNDAGGGEYWIECDWILKDGIIGLMPHLNWEYIGINGNEERQKDDIINFIVDPSKDIYNSLSKGYHPFLYASTADFKNGKNVNDSIDFE